MREFKYVDERTLRGADGTLHDVLGAIDELPWTRQWCPFMPHEYAILRRSPEQAWYLLEAMIALSPSAIGRSSAAISQPTGTGKLLMEDAIGAPDSRSTAGMPLTRPISDAETKARTPSRTGTVRTGRPTVPATTFTPLDGKWWPSPKFFAEGYDPCRACRKPPAGLRPHA